jgi:epoxyqueuosine reductase
MDLLKKIEDKLRDNGIVLFGTGFVEDKISSDLKSMPYAISIGMRYPYTIIDQIKDGPTITYFHQYRTMNANLDRCAIIAQSILLSNGYEAMYVPASQSDPKADYSGIFSHKIAAIRAGLGFIGKNNLFLSNEFGPAVRLSTILTDMELDISAERISGCNDCNECFSACPAGAIFGVMPNENYDRKEIFSPEKCSYYMSTKFKDMGRGSVCGICIGVCPYSKPNSK